MLRHLAPYASGKVLVSRDHFSWSEPVPFIFSLPVLPSRLPLSSLFLLCFYLFPVPLFPPPIILCFLVLFFFFNLLWKNIHNKIDLFDHFCLDSPGALSTLICLCDHQSSPVPRTSSSSQTKTLNRLNSSLLPLPPAPTILFSVSMN